MIVIDREKCIGCGLCVKDCLNRAIRITDGKADVFKKCFRCGHCIAVCPSGAVSTTPDDEYSMDDVIDVVPDETVIPADRMLRVIQCRRSIRHYQDRQVEREKIEAVLEAGRFSPTASNSQNVSYIVIRDRMKEFNETAMRLFRSYNSDENFGKLFAPPFSRDRIDFSDDDFLFKGAPCVVLLVTPNDVNAGIAGANMELVANGLGLGMLYVGFFVHLANKNEEMRNYLGLRENDHVSAALCFGYPDIEYRRSVPRKKLRADWM